MLPVAETLHELEGKAATYTAAGEAGAAVSVRCQAGQTTQQRDRRSRRARTTGILYLRTSEISTRPKRDDTILIAVADDPWSGTWYLDADAEPSGADEWRCLCWLETQDGVIAQQAGSPRRRS